MANSLPFEVFLALRHLRSRQRRRAARATTVIAVVGIALGVAALIVALSLAKGFQTELRNKILRGTEHLTVMRSDGRAIENYGEVATQVREVDGVVAASATTYDGAMLIGPNSTAYAVLRGVDSASYPVNDDVQEMIVDGSGTLGPDPDAPQYVVIGSELAARTGLKVGQMAEIILADTGLGARPTKLSVQVTGIFRSGLYEYDSTWVYISLPALRVLHSGSPAASVISVKADDIDRVKEVSARIKNRLGPGYTSVDWQEANRPLFTALAVERRIGIIIIGLIVLIAALNITTTLILLVLERRREIAILRAMGTARASIMSIFVVQGAVIGIAGAVTGVLVGAAGVWVANRYKLVSLPADVYSISEVPLTFQLRDVLLAASIAFLLSVLATLYPARAASKIRPAALLRNV